MFSGLEDDCFVRGDLSLATLTFLPGSFGDYHKGLVLCTSLDLVGRLPRCPCIESAAMLL